MTVRRGEIYLVEFDPVKGSEQGGMRPALVVQNDLGNRTSPTTVVAAITTKIPAKHYPFTVKIEPSESGLPYLSAVLCNQIATIQAGGIDSRLRAPKGRNDVIPLGRLGPEKMKQVDQALCYSLGMI